MSEPEERAMNEPEEKDRNEPEEHAQEPVAVVAETVAEGEVPRSEVVEAVAESPSAEEVAARRVRETEDADAKVLESSRSHTRRAFLGAAVGVAAGYGMYRYVESASGEGMQPGPLRKAFEANAAISRGVFQDAALAPTYPMSRAEVLRVNGLYGLKMPLKPESWRLQVVGVQGAVRHARYVPDVTAWKYEYTGDGGSGEGGSGEGGFGEDRGHDTKVDPNVGTSAKMAPEEAMKKAGQDENHTGRSPRGFEESGESRSTLAPHTPGLLLTMADVLRLPRHELVTEFKCIEGWSQIVQWAGVRMADFLEAYPPADVDGREPKFVYMETPDGDYYTGYDMRVMRHPQTLLVTEMMGAALTQFHGAPLRLHMPTKYGYKQIKRIGLIAYTGQKPDDYWTKLGYDWYAGL